MTSFLYVYILTNSSSVFEQLKGVPGVLKLVVKGVSNSSPFLVSQLLTLPCSHLTIDDRDDGLENMLFDYVLVEVFFLFVIVIIIFYVHLIKV